MKKIFIVLILVWHITNVFAQDQQHSEPVLNVEQIKALKKIKEISSILEFGKYPRISPDTFLAQLSNRIKYPYQLHQGRSLFCWSAIPIAYLYEHEPVKMVDAMIGLYQHGIFNIGLDHGNIHLVTTNPSIEAVGTRTFSKENNVLKGRLLDQMLFLAYADHYKCWLNLDKHYNRGDQKNPFWAGSTLSKETKVWQDLGFDAVSVGNNFQWFHKNKANTVKKELEKGRLVVLYINGMSFNKEWMPIAKVKLIPPVPVFASHFILLKEIEEKENMYQITFWDRNGLQHITMSHKRFQHAVFGFTSVECDPEIPSYSMAR